LTSEKIAIAGAGLAGAVLARRLAERTGIGSVVFESRDHIGGNCHTRRDERTGVMVHEHGPHIFNTPHAHVWQWADQYADFVHWRLRARATTPRGVFSLPINLLTLNQFFDARFSPTEAEAFVATLGDETIESPRTFEEKALATIGRELYANFFEGYTTKQWGRSPKELPASIFNRLPISFTYDDNYHFGAWSGIPRDGYTAMIERILDHPAIEVKLETRAESAMQDEFRHLSWSGPIDGYFDHALGRLRYRTVHWEHEYARGEIVGGPVMNYTGLDVEHTRVIEHKHFAPWEQHDESLAYIEYSKETGPGDMPYYPLGLDEDKALYARYLERAEQERGVSFIGRLGTYRYLDMDKVIEEMLRFADDVGEAFTTGQRSVAPTPTPLAHA